MVSAVFAFFAVRDVRLEDVWDGLRQSNYWWLVPSLLALAASVLLRTVRWRYLFAKETRPPFGPTFRATIVGYFFNIVLPARAGEAARVLALCQETRTSKAEAARDGRRRARVRRPLTARVALSDGSVHPAHKLASVGTGARRRTRARTRDHRLTLALFGVRPLHFVLRPLAWLPFVTPEMVEALGDGVGRGLAGLRDLRLVALACALSALNLLALSLSVWFVMEGFDLRLPVVAAMLVVVATNLVQILPSSPAALGVFEAATLIALRVYDVEDAEALSYAIVLHAVHVLPFIAVGLVLLRGTFRSRPRSTI